MERFNGILPFGTSFQSDISMALAKELNVKLPAVICYRTLNDVKQQLNYEGDLTVDEMETFVYNNGVPLFVSLVLLILHLLFDFDIVLFTRTASYEITF